MLFLFFFSALCEWGGWVLKSAENSALFFETFPYKFLPSIYPQKEPANIIMIRKITTSTFCKISLMWGNTLSPGGLKSRLKIFKD